MKTPVDIAVTGAAGQIAYSLLFRLAAGELLGSDQPINLHLLEIPPALPALSGVMMELQDCAYPLLNKVIASSDAERAFQSVDYAFLLGARPRSQGMERRDLLQANAEIFSVQGRALNAVASREVKVLVTGNPANTNALIACHNAPDLSPANFAAMSMLDHNRALAQLAEKAGVTNRYIKNMIVWGNHSATQYPDLHYATIKGQDALSIIEWSWFVDQFIPSVQQRGSQIIAKRGLSSAASAANAAIAQMKAWINNTDDNDWLSMAIMSDGSYGIESGLFFSFPVVVNQGNIEMVADLKLNEFSRERLRLTEMELKSERDEVRHLL
ncbi:MAG: hypothetical protein RL637_1669 [Pseudomonadota bacterium]|jgi:malate dehydrogenase